MNQPGVDNLNRPQGSGSATPHGGYVFPPGSRPLDGYTIREGIGWGGFGEVYHATSDGGKEVALKLIRRNLDVELRGLRQCLNLKHPHLLDVYDIREDADGSTWIVMELVNGSRLADRLDAYPQGMPLDMALRWFHGIAMAVDYLHKQKIVHRDLKPGNIFCDDGVVKVGDYGLAKFMSSDRRAAHTESIGTVHYLAPEVAGGEYDYRMDIYALGIMLCEMVTGQVPFDGESVGEILMKHMTAAPDLSRVPQPIRDVVARALEKNPRKRYASVAEMVAALPGSDSTVDVLPMPAQLVGENGQASAPILRAEMVDVTPGPGSPQLGTGAGPRPQYNQHVPQPQQVRYAQAVPQTHPGQHQATPLWIKCFAAIGIGAAVLFTIPILFPFVLIFLVVYLCANTTNHLFVSPKSQPSAIDAAAYGNRNGPVFQGQMPPVAQPIANQPTGMRVAHAVGQRRPVPPIDLERGLRGQIARLPVRTRVSELIGSLIVALLVAVPTCAATVLLRGHVTHFPPAQMVWVGVVGLLAGWSVLTVSKLWETDAGEQLPRRFVLMVVGMGLGALAWGLMTHLMIDLPRPNNWTPRGGENLFFLADGQPKIAAFMGSFAILMLSIRWWKLADPARRVRLGFWGSVAVMIIACIVTSITHFPAPWLIMVACVMLVTIQLAAPSKFKKYRKSVGQ